MTLERPTKDKATCHEAVTMPSAAPTKTIVGAKVLVAEDEVLVAMTLIDMVEDLGAEAIGPFAKVSECHHALIDSEPDIAILDVRLRDGESFEIAQILTSRGIPVIFHSGHMIDTQWTGRADMVRFCGKPCIPSKMQAELMAALAN